MSTIQVDPHLSRHPGITAPATPGFPRLHEPPELNGRFLVAPDAIAADAFPESGDVVVGRWPGRLVSYTPEQWVQIAESDRPPASALLHGYHVALVLDD